MDIEEALRQEKARLQKQLSAIQEAITALNGRATGAQSTSRLNGRRKRELSAAARAKISKAAKQRWAKFGSEKSKGTKAK